jgi:CheY-like chemotaxis protein
MYLAANAADAIGPNEGTVTIRTGTLQCDAAFLEGVVADDPVAPGCHAFIEVTDTGCGMDADTRANILEPFFTTKNGHRGLGLASIRGIVSGHGGAIKVHSERNKGSSFMVLLPFQGAAAAPLQCDVAPAAPAPEEDLATWQGTGTVLVVEDEPLVGRYVEQALRGAGFTVLCAPDGEEGLRLFRERAEAIDLTLLDMTMPKMSGREALTAMRAVRPNAAIVLCSGDLSSCSDLPADGFLQKPFAIDVLLRTVRDVLAGKRATI